MQKVLAHAGIGSRRECEEFILHGRVTVDGKVVRELGTRVEPGQAIAVDGERIKLERMVYYAVNKPKGYVSTNDDPAGRPRVVDLLPEIPERVYSVGRLDEDSTGLMILTNDGELANRLAHPRYGVEKTYRALVAGSPPPEVIRKLSEGIWLSDGKVRAKRARVVGSQGEATQIELVLAEGKKREIRRMLAKLGHKVMTLTRIAIGPVVLKGLLVGEHRPLSRTEVDLLQKVAAGIEVSPPRFLGRGGDDSRGRGRSAGRGPARGAPKGQHGPEGREERAPRRPAADGGRERSARGQAGEKRPPRGVAPASGPSAERRPPRGAAPASGPSAERRPPRGVAPASGPSAESSQPRRVPGKPPASKPLPGKPATGRPEGAKPPEPASKKLPGRPAGPKPVQPAARPDDQEKAPRRPPARAAARKTATNEEGPKRRIIGLAPRIAEEAGLSITGKPPRKRPGLKRRPPRRVFGIRRPEEGEGGDES